MALSDLTFKLYTDTALTVAFSGLYQLTHNTDLSDNPQDTLYFGSATASRKLQTSASPGVSQITLTPTVIIPVWLASTAYTLGQTRIPTVGNTFRYEITTAGTSGSSEPTWPLSLGSTVVDGTCIWTCVSKTHPPTEIKLATTEVGLDTATGGAALNLGTTINSLSSNRVDVWIRVTNTVTTVGSNTGTPELGLYINSVVETPA